MNINVNNQDKENNRDKDIQTLIENNSVKDVSEIQEGDPKTIKAKKSEGIMALIRRAYNDPNMKYSKERIEKFRTLNNMGPNEGLIEGKIYKLEEGMKENKEENKQVNNKETITLNLSKYIGIAHLTIEELQNAYADFSEAKKIVIKEVEEITQEEFPEDLLFRLMLKESTGRHINKKTGKITTSPSGAKGYFQLLSSAITDANDELKETYDVNKPIDNCVLGMTYYLTTSREEVKKFAKKDITQFALAAYNLGAGGTKKLYNEIKKKKGEDPSRYEFSTYITHNILKVPNAIRRVSPEYNIWYIDKLAGDKFQKDKDKILNNTISKAKTDEVIGYVDMIMIMKTPKIKKLQHGEIIAKNSDSIRSIIRRAYQEQGKSIKNSEIKQLAEKFKKINSNDIKVGHIYKIPGLWEAKNHEKETSIMIEKIVKKGMTTFWSFMKKELSPNILTDTIMENFLNDNHLIDGKDTIIPGSTYFIRKERLPADNNKNNKEIKKGYEILPQDKLFTQLSKFIIILTKNNKIEVSSSHKRHPFTVKNNKLFIHLKGREVGINKKSIRIPEQYRQQIDSIDRSKKELLNKLNTIYFQEIKYIAINILIKEMKTGTKIKRKDGAYPFYLEGGEIKASTDWLDKTYLSELYHSTEDDVKRLNKNFIKILKQMIEKSNISNKERFLQGKKYYLEKYETLGKKKLTDIYKNIPLPSIITVDNGKKSGKIIKSKTNTQNSNINYIILHSTAGIYINDKETAKQIYAHFLIGQDGKIYQINRNGKLRILTHAGKNKWNGKNLNNQSIGIEVEAIKEWTDKQYRAIQQLLKRITTNINPDIKAENVLTHSQIAFRIDENNKKLRGRKSDPYYVNREKLQPRKDGKSPINPGKSNEFYFAKNNNNNHLFPNNYTLFDPDVANGIIDANLSAIKDYYQSLAPTNYQNMISGLKISEKITKEK